MCIKQVDGNLLNYQVIQKKLMRKALFFFRWCSVSASSSSMQLNRTLLSQDSISRWGKSHWSTLIDLQPLIQSDVSEFKKRQTQSKHVLSTWNSCTCVTEDNWLIKICFYFNSEDKQATKHWSIIVLQSLVLPWKSLLDVIVGSEKYY